MNSPAHPPSPMPDPCTAPRLHATETTVLAAMRGECPQMEAIAAVCQYQDEYVPGLQAFWRRRGFDPHQSGWQPHEIPALPTETFRTARLVSREAPPRVVFRTSGTTGAARGEHWHISTRAYETGAWLHASTMLPLAQEQPLLLPLALPLEDSSLAHMIRTFQDKLPDPQPPFALDAQGALHQDILHETVARARELQRPVLLFGTAFALADAIAQEALPSLPEGSRILTTGGFKGYQTSLSPAELRDALIEATGVAPRQHHIEYGMTEWSSQLYSAEALDGASTAHAGRLVAPPWCALTVVDPETLQPLPDRETGLVRIVDPANVDTVIAIQTSDLGRIVDGRLELVGRNPGAPPRGCSLAIEELQRLLRP